MNKASKILISIGLILLLILLFFVIIENQFAVALPFNLIAMDNYPLIGSQISVFLFWASIGFAILAIIALFVVIFFPKQTSTLVIPSETGELVIQKKAIENFVLQIVEKEPFMENPSVKVKMLKRKIKVDVNGKMRRVMAVPEKQNALVADINTELRNLMGVRSHVETSVKLKDTAKEKQSNDESARVV